MAISYVKTIWANNITPLNQGNMNHIEDGIETCVNAINQLMLDAGYQLALSYSDSVLTVKLKNKDGTELDSKNVDIKSLNAITLSGTTLSFKSGSTELASINLDPSGTDGFYSKIDINNCFTEVTVDPD